MILGDDLGPTIGPIKGLEAFSKEYKKTWNLKTIMDLMGF